MRRVFKTIVSIVLSLTFIFSYLNFMQDDVSAATARIVLGQTITVPEEDYTYEFRPDKTGYYLLETHDWSYVEVTDNSNDTILDLSYVIPVGLADSFGDEYKSVYYMEYGKSYSVYFSGVCEFVLRRADKYVNLNVGNRNITASLEKPFTLSINPTLSPNLKLDQAVSYWWTDIPGDPGYTTSSITLNLGDLLDNNERFIFSYDYGDNDSDFGRGFVSCYVSALYNGNEYGWWVTFDIFGYKTEFSAACVAYEEDDSYVWSLPYHYEYDDQFFNVKTTKPSGVSASYQWYRIDSAKKKAGNYQKESDLFIKLNGQTYNYFNYNQSARNALGEPYFDINGDDTEVYTELACVVKFTKGSAFVEKVLHFRFDYCIGVSTYTDCFVKTSYTSTVTLPKDTKWIVNDVENDGSFIEDPLPKGFGYSYTWYNLNSVPEYGGFAWSGTGATADIYDVLGDNIDYLGTGKSFTVNPQTLTLQYNDGYYEAYVACFIVPTYNGTRCYSNAFEVYIEVFKLSFGSFRLDSYTSACEVHPGDKVDINVEVESVFDVAYQWQELKGKNWVNVNSESAQTSTLLFTANEESQYRCIVTDAQGNTLYTEPCVITFLPGPYITGQPGDVYAYVGDTAQFTVDAYGENLNYQWQLKKGSKWANLSAGGANTSTLSVKVDDSKNGKTYRCVITDDKGNELYSNEVSIFVIKPAIDITTQPKNYSGPVGSTAKFSVAAEGEGLTYQWQLKKGKTWADLSSGGAKTPTMSIKVDDSKNGKTYRCLITNAAGEQVATDEVTITVKNPDINITSQPSDFTGLEGSTAKFSVAAEGEGLTYQWQLKKGKTWADLSTGGAKTASMSIKVDASKNGKIYRCLITNAAGEQLATNEVTITVKQPSNAIVITKQPQNTETYEGGTAGFMVEAEGEGLTYQWQLKKGSSWANLTSGGATTNWLSIGKCDLSKNGKVYRCVITDANGEQIITNEVTLTVYYVVYRSEAVKSGESAPDAEVPATATEPAAEPVNDAPAPAEAPADEPAPAPVEEPAPAPVEAPAEAQADSPVEEPA
ncbi:hypothetical protein B0O40_0624 [Ruminococcaceae bacterium R-25]|nr:hypothetical protein B0O40_0624 [Ruminococcaceae bacterium R-25]SUQ11254.1 hypothetical protein SAMN06297423_0624 [Oscillospiraceae bacterium]